MAEAGGASGEKGVWNGVSAGFGAGVDGAGVVEGLARRGTRLGVASKAGCAQIFPGGLACGLDLRDWLNWLNWFAAIGASALRGAVGASKPRSWLREANIDSRRLCCLNSNKFFRRGRKNGTVFSLSLSLSISDCWLMV